jgi:hypothetical protein
VNFAIGNGLGIAVLVEKKTPGQLTFPTNQPHHGSDEYSSGPRR